MPSLARLPGFLWRKLGRVGRALVALLALAGLAAVIVSIPACARPGAGTPSASAMSVPRPPSGASSVSASWYFPRRVWGVRSTAALERVIDIDVLRRDRRRPLRVRCRPISGRGRFSCLAVTAEAGSTRGNRGVEIGFPYRALIDPSTGRGAICRALGRPGEGSLGRLKVTNPEACGG